MRCGTICALLIGLCLWSATFAGICRAEPTMVENNLFSPDRKPVSDEEAAPQTTNRQGAQTGLPPRSVQLDGVFIHDSVRKALVRVSSQLLGEPKAARGKSRDKGKDQFPYMTVLEGESIGDFKVVKVEPRSISLEKDNQVYDIGLFMDGKVVPPAAPLPAAPISPEPAAPPQGQAGAAPPEQPQQSGQQPAQPAPQQGAQPAAQPPVAAAAPPPGGAEQPSAAAGTQPPAAPPARPASRIPGVAPQ